jgi:tRNA(Ile)-lysidine synthase
MNQVVDYTMLEFPKSSKKRAVAVSGGADSMCLAYLCDQCSQFQKADMVALIVDHGLRPESSREAAWVQKFLEKKGISAEILVWEGNKPKVNIHQHARKARYKLLTEYCKTNDIEYLLVAHNLEDQAETVLLRIYRGSGIDGISGISSKVKMNGVTIMRPLLKCSRKQIEATLEQAGWEWVNDPSNTNVKYSRTQVRNLLNGLEEKDVWVNRLCLLADNAGRARLYLEKETKKAINSIVTIHFYGYALIDHEGFCALEEEIALRALSYCLKKISGNVYPPRFDSLKRIYKLIKQKHKIAATLWGCELKQKKQNIVIYRELKATEAFRPLEENQVWDKRYKIKPYPEAYVGPLGSEGWKAIKATFAPKNKPEAPFVSIFYTCPALFDKNGKLLATLFYKNKNYFQSLICES